MKNKYLNSIYFPNDFVVEPYDYSPMRKNVRVVEKREEADGRLLSILEREKAEKLKEEGKWDESMRFRGVKLTKKERMVTNTYQYIDLYPEGLLIEFKPGINIIVGENGCGKTTLMNLLHKYVVRNVKDDFQKIIEGPGEDEQENERFDIFETNYGTNVSFDTQDLSPKNFFGWDFEKDNPVTNEKIKPVAGEDAGIVAGKLQSIWAAAEESHGETSKGCLGAFLVGENNLIIFDEPETALSLGAQYEYWEKIKKAGELNQIIMISHSKVFIEEAGEVYDLESKKWMNSNEYINKIKKSVK